MSDHNTALNFKLLARSAAALAATLAVVMAAMLMFGNNAIADTVSDNGPSSLIPPEYPKQSITYWKKYTLPEDNTLVQQSQDVFTVLLRAWDQSRIEPGLFVVESEVGAWAASLADGNILLSKQAVETCFSFGEQRGEHLLAFVLAHELAHQRADDLWHQRFFRMIGGQSTESQQKMMAGLALDTEQITQLEKKEAQADHDGLVLMSSVGYDPYQIINDKDFFTLWVENLWQENCSKDLFQKSNHNACRQAQARALRAQAQLETVANQSMLYELGVQAFVAGNYAQAREYFTIYGRDYPGRAIISAIGLSYFAQAQDLQKQLVNLAAYNGINNTDFYYPMILDARVNQAVTEESQQNKRANKKSQIIKLEKQKSALLAQSIDQFEKAVRLAPDYQQTYLLLASAHLLANNSYRVRGVLQGQYIPRFGDDSSVDMLLALTTAIEGNSRAAIDKLNEIIDHFENNSIVSSLPDNILRYSTYYNLAELYRSDNRMTEEKQVWMDLAKSSQKKGDTLLFRLALNHVNQGRDTGLSQKLHLAPAINGNRLGNAGISSNLLSPEQKAELWIDGERYQIIRDNNSRYILRENGELISAWQNDAGAEPASISNKLNTGDSADRPFKTLGIPDRRLNMTSGEYLAFDDYGLAVRISNNKVKGWFLYDTP